MILIISTAIKTIGSWFAHNKILTGSVVSIMGIIIFLGSGYIHIQNLKSELANQDIQIEKLSNSVNKQNEAIRSLASKQEKEIEESKERVERELKRQKSIKEDRENINNAEELNKWLSDL